MNCFQCGKILERGSIFATLFGGGSQISIHPDCINTFITRLVGERLFFKPESIKELGTPMKVWLHQEADKHKRCAHTIYHRLLRHPSKYYPNVQLTRLNKRVVFVREGRAEAI